MEQFKNNDLRVFKLDVILKNPEHNIEDIKILFHFGSKICNLVSENKVQDFFDDYVQEKQEHILNEITSFFAYIVEKMEKENMELVLKDIGENRELFNMQLSMSATKTIGVLEVTLDTEEDEYLMQLIEALAGKEEYDFFKNLLGERITRFCTDLLDDLLLPMIINEKPNSRNKKNNIQ